MASALSQALRKQREGTLKRGPGGQLSQETPEEIQSLAGQAGLQAPPTTAIGAAGIGANKDQQKMMGTPAQKEAAVSMAQAPVEQGLGAALRRQQSRTEMTTEEQGQLQKSQDMENLGSLGDRVTQFINNQRQALQTQAQAANTQNQLEVRGADQFQGKDITSIKSLLQKYRDNPTDQSVLLELNKALGYDINRQLSTAEVDQLYESAVDTIARGGAGNVDNDLTVEDLIAQGNFGYDKAQLSQLLGIPEDQLSTMNVGQLRDQIQRVGDEEFSQTQALEEKAVSGELGQAERGLARQAAREASATGVRATEADYQNLENQISAADQVFFNGKEYNIEDLLKDETISNIIKDYMESGPDSELRKQLEKFEPKLLEFIQKNEAVLQEASQNMQVGAQTFKETQDFNKSLQSVGGIKMADSLIDAFLPESRSLQEGRIDPANVPIYAASQGLSGPEQQTYINNLNSEVQNDPLTVEDLKGLSTGQIQAWQIGGGADSPWQTNYIRPKRTYEAIVRAGDNADELVKIAIRNVQNAEEASKKLGDTRGIAVLGFGPSVEGSVVDVNGDGNLDSTSSIRSQLLGANPRPKLSGGPGSNKTYQQIDVKNPSQLQGPQKELFDKINWATQDGQISGDDLQKSGLSLDNLVELKFGPSGNNRKIDTAAMDSIWSEARNSNTSSTIDKIENSGGSSIDKLEKLNNELKNQTDKKLNPDMIEAKSRAILDDIARADAQASAEDRERTRNRLRQQKQIISLAVPYFAVLPPEMQNAIMDSVTEAGGKVIDELKKVDWDGNRTTPENITIAAKQLTTAPYRALSAGVGSVASDIGKKIGGATGAAIQNLGGMAQGGGSGVINAVGGGGCFQAGTKFLVYSKYNKDSIVARNVEELQPGDRMFLGENIIATAQFIGKEIYQYGDVIVNGSHAVLEEGKWVRVRDSKLAVRQPELDGTKVYVVWNEKHRMVTVDETVWTDYAETDSTVSEIEEQRNIEILNRQTP